MPARSSSAGSSKSHLHAQEGVEQLPGREGRVQRDDAVQEGRLVDDVDRLRLAKGGLLDELDPLRCAEQVHGALERDLPRAEVGPEPDVRAGHAARRRSTTTAA